MDALQVSTFRLLFGCVMVIECARLVGTERADLWYVRAPLQIAFPGFEWVPVPGSINEMRVFFFALATASACVAAGRFYRPASMLLFGLYLWFFLFDASCYNNHYYLISIFAAGLTCTDTHRVVGHHCLLPRWQVDLFRYQMLAVYFFAGLAKTNADWMRGYPARKWCNEAFEEAFSEVFDGEHPTAALYWIPETITALLSYGGLVFDLLIPFGLTAGSRRTRCTALVLTLVFHGINSCIFNIGIFPVLGMCTSVLFVPPDDIRRFRSRFCCGRSQMVKAAQAKDWARRPPRAFRMEPRAHSSPAGLPRAHAGGSPAAPLCVPLRFRPVGQLDR